MVFSKAISFFFEKRIQLEIIFRFTRCVLEGLITKAVNE